MSLIDEYAQTLAELTGNDFQVEVCARLQSVILGFQTVPAKPSGDAGLDGFSHNGEHAYCCYGPERDEFKSAKGRESGIVKKFSSDLRRLLELDFVKRQLVCITNVEMATILPDGQKIKHVELVVNWFESHRILNPILSAVAEYKKVSKCRYLDPNASVVVVGPTNLANRFAVDEITIGRARQRMFIRSVQDAAQTIKIQDPKDFSSKMATLREIRPDQEPAIHALAEQLLKNWRTALAFEGKLHDTLPTLHQALEHNRQGILTRVAELMLSSDAPWTQLGHAEEIAKDILDQDFGKQYGPLIRDVSSGEIARLIGECPISWAKPGSTNVK